MSLKLARIKKSLESEPGFRIAQAVKAVYEQGIESWSEVSVFSKDLRARLEEECPLLIKADPTESRDSDTVKALFDFAGDRVEAVLMRHDKRNTVCVSTQVGCALACDFCLTGTLGFKRNLSADEIVNQVLFFSRWLKDKGERVGSVVYMGMGEPFLNYDEVLESARMLNDKNMFSIGARHISISTSGVIPGIKKLAKESMQINLSVSLHAPDDAIRSELMPINKKYPLDELLSAVLNYTQKTNRRVMIEYVMIKGINDSATCAHDLAGLLKESLGSLFFVNIIKYNQTGKYRASDRKKIETFKRILEQSGITVVERYRFGDDIKGACGQLSARH